MDLLGELLKDPDRVTRRVVARSLSRRALDERGAVKLLADALGDSDPSVQQEALHGIGDLKHEGLEATDAVLRALGPRDDQPRGAAIGALLEIGADPKAIAPALAALLPDSLAEDALATLGADAIPPVLPLLGAADPAVRQAALRVLERIGEPASEALPDMLELLQDQDARTREAAVRALARVGAGSAEALRRLGMAIDDPERQVGETAISLLCDLAAKRVEGVAALRAALSGRRPGSEDRFPDALSRCDQEDPSLARAVLGASEDRDPFVRGFFVRTLGDIAVDAPDVMPRLLAALKDDDASVRLAATDALRGPVGKRRAAVPGLIALLTDPDSQVRCGAAWALRDLGKEGQGAVPALRGVLLQDADEEPRRAAFEAIRAITSR